LSFHATKVFNTFEGGAIVCADAKMKQRIDYLKNFGFADETTVVAPGINGKMNEFSAALGLVQLRHIDAVIDRRGAIDALYRERLEDVPGIRCLARGREMRYNFAYFPILVGSDYPLSRDALYHRLKENGFHARRYFYPLIAEFPMYRGLPSAQQSQLPVAFDVASRVLCLPLYPALADDDVERICHLIRKS